MSRFLYTKYLILLVIAALHHSWAQAGTWHTAASLNTPRVGAASVKWNQYLYVFGGKTSNNLVLNTVERYHPATNTWEATSVAPFSYPRYNAAATVYNNKIFLTGGRDQNHNATDKVEVYDPVQNTWHEVHKLREKREGHAAVVFNDTLYVLGGIEQQYSYVEDIEWYDPNQDEWEDLEEEIIEPRAAAFIATFSHYLYMCGGEYMGLMNNTFIADTNFSWFSGAVMQTGRNYGGTAVANNRIYMIGGETNNPSLVTSLVEYYDPVSLQIGLDTPMPTPRSGLTAVAFNDTIYSIGGYSVNHFQILPVVEYLVPGPSGIHRSNQFNKPVDFLQIKGYPNPFNSTIQLQVDVPATDFYTINIYDVTGRQTRTIYQGNLTPGHHQFQWDGKTRFREQAASGIYFAVIKSKEHIQKMKIIYAK